MKHNKFLVLLMAIATIMSATVLPASACTADENGNVTPCEQVEEKGYCTKRNVSYFDGTYVHIIDNPYYDEEKILQAAQEAAEQEKKAENQSDSKNNNVSGTIWGGVGSDAEEEAEPEFPLADVAVPIRFRQGTQWEWVNYDAVRISHAVSQETVMYEGEPIELYTIYPNAMVWKTRTNAYSPMKVYDATLENGTLTAGDLNFELEIEEPLSHLGYLRWNEQTVGNYYIAEIGDTCFNKKIGIHVVEGTLPENVPVHYAGDVGLSQSATYTDGIHIVPVGTVVTLPYDTAAGHASSSRFCATTAWSMDPYPSQRAALDDIYRGGDGWEKSTPVESYLSNGRKSFTVEPGKMYHVNYTQCPFSMVEGVVDEGVNEAHIFIMAEGSVPTASTATPSTQTVNVDGKDVTFAMYALNGGSTNYIRVRDLAAALNGTAAQFNVGWNGNVTLTSKTPYDGATDKAPFSTPMSYTDYTAPTYVDGKAVNLEAIQIEFNGGGFTYYKLRDLAQALNFNVSWSDEKGIFVETNKPYDPAN